MPTRRRSNPDYNLFQLAMHPFVDRRRSAAAFRGIAVLALALVWAACSQHSATHDGKRHAILVAAGGGYTGMYSGYRLWSDGVLESWSASADGRDSSHPLFTFHPDTTTYFFARLRFIGFDRVAFSVPGNLTRFVRSETASGNHEVRWGDIHTAPPPEVAAFYDEFMMVVKARRGTE